MGDNTLESQDSRFFGFVQLKILLEIPFCVFIHLTDLEKCFK